MSDFEPVTAEEARSAIEMDGEPIGVCEEWPHRLALTIIDLHAEREALLADKARLDWLEKCTSLSRESIDVARGEWVG